MPNLVKTLLGDAAKCQQWYPFAKSKLEQLIKQSEDAGGAAFTNNLYVDDGKVHIKVRVVDDNYWIYIDAEGGCTDKQGFLLMKEGSQYWFANYVDGHLEAIVPPEGSPRPEPDSCERTCSVKLPGDLLSTTVTKRASFYTGQMREIVQCDHINARNTRYTYTWNKTHGILEYPRPRTVGATEEEEAANAVNRRFWIIEVSPNGVYAAPIIYHGKCCELDISENYTPTDEELELHPDWYIYKYELSLYWYYNNHPQQESVVELLNAGQVGVLYNLGSPLFEKCGWAFSYSGHECQNVIFYPDNDADLWYVSRVKIAFTVSLVDGKYKLLATPSIEVNRAPYVGVADALFWFPSEQKPGYYEQMFPFSYNSGHPDINWSEIPLYVYYIGDDPKILTTTTIKNEAVTEIEESCGNAISVFGLMSCIGSSKDEKRYSQKVQNFMSFDETIFGGESYSMSEEIKSQLPTDQSAWFLTTASCYQNIFDWSKMGVREIYDEEANESRNINVAAIANILDRESVVLLSENIFSRSEEKYTSYGTWRMLRSSYKYQCPIIGYDSSGWPIYDPPDRGIPYGAPLGELETNIYGCEYNLSGCDIDVVQGDAQDAYEDFGIPAKITYETDSDSSESYNGIAYFGPAPVTIPVSATADSHRFLIPIPPSDPFGPFRAPGVQGMHGGLYYADPALTPSDQSENYVYHTGEKNSPWITSDGFFEPTNDQLGPVAFLGKV